MDWLCRLIDNSWLNLQKVNLLFSSKIGFGRFSRRDQSKSPSNQTQVKDSEKKVGDVKIEPEKKPTTRNSEEFGKRIKRSPSNEDKPKSEGAVTVEDDVSPGKTAAGFGRFRRRKTGEAQNVKGDIDNEADIIEEDFKNPESTESKKSEPVNSDKENQEKPDRIENKTENFNKILKGFEDWANDLHSKQQNQPKKSSKDKDSPQEEPKEQVDDPDNEEPIKKRNKKKTKYQNLYNNRPFKNTNFGFMNNNKSDDSNSNNSSSGFGGGNGGGPRRFFTMNTLFFIASYYVG